MAKIDKVQEVAIEKLVPYEKNAKLHSPEQVKAIANSIQEFGFLNACLIDKDYNIIAGHGRVEAAKRLGMEKVPCTFVEGLTEEQRRAYILADNKLAEMGEWDYDLVFDELQDLSFEMATLTGFDVPEPTADWFETREKYDRERQEDNDEYNDFLDKFEDPKTTDDCYTPDNIYEVVAEYVAKKYHKDRKDFVRPFYPGGDYQNYKYKEQDVVVDNPPFSILAEIVDFYVEKKQAFFLFAPGPSTFGYIARDRATAICVYASVTYENGASVITSFITNLEPKDVAAIADAELYDKIAQANKENEEKMHRQFPKYEFPREVITAAKMGYLAKYGQSMTIKKNDSYFIRNLDSMKEKGKTIFGGALLLSEKAAAEKAAAEKAAAEVWVLSDREKDIIKSLSREEAE